MRRFRPLFLLVVLFALLAGYYVYTSLRVHVETISFESRLVGKPLPYTVVLPPGQGLIIKRKKYPVLYLLHGWNGHAQDWITETKIAEYAARFELIIVLPEGGNGWYTDSATVPTDKYESYILQELIPDVEHRFRVIKERRGRGVAGFSMGGYGALKFGLKHPEMFAFAASMSGAFDAPARSDDVSIMQTFGAVDNPVRSANDLFKLAGEMRDNSVTALPYFYMDCGTDDYWLSANRQLDRVFSERKVAHEYGEHSGGHDWKYWDRQVQDVLRVASEKLSPAQ
jgi:S-formylglutathione hydrolase FrmB